MKKFKLYLYMLLGNFIIGISIGLLQIAQLGTDPFSSINVGLSQQFSISFGTAQCIMNIILFLPMVLFAREGLGLGTLVNMLGCGFVADLTLWVMEKIGITIASVEHLMFVRFGIMIVGVLLISFGIAMYMECDLGVAPYDALGQILEKFTKGKLKFKWARIITDVICVVIGYLFGAVIGIATIITAFFVGPFISWSKEHIMKGIM